MAKHLQRITVDPASEAPETLVVVFLRGGADTLNFFAPYASDDYYRNRPTISLARPGERGDSLIRLDECYGLHPSMSALEAIFHSGRLGVVQGVGTDSPTGSHFECQDQIEQGDAFTKNTGGGWLGRHLRAVSGVDGGHPFSAVAIGKTLPESLRGANGASVFEHLSDIKLSTPSGDPSAAAAALAKLYGADVGVLGRHGSNTLKMFRQVEAMQAKEYAPEKGVEYPDDSFANGLKEVARLIKANLGLRVACLDLGGWDTHFFQGAASSIHAERAGILANALSAFDRDVAPMASRVTTVVMTEFGRRLYENASLGTDHGQGFALFAIGDRINGGKIHGKWPLNETTLSGPGGLEVSLDYRSVLAEILEGTTENRNLETVFPDLARAESGIVKARI